MRHVRPIRSWEARGDNEVEHLNIDGQSYQISSVTWSAFAIRSN